jgi:PEP-CTERM motif
MTWTTRRPDRYIDCAKVFRQIATKSAATLAGIALIAVASPARAGSVTDPLNDFIPTFTGTKSADLDVLSTFATFDGTAFHIGATLAGNVGTLPTALYVFGFDRGVGSSNFAAIGLPGVTFDAVITLTGAGVAGGRDLIAGVPIVLPAGSVQISGASFRIDIPAALLPSLGLSPGNYGVNLWPRDSSQVGNAQISDFAPNATTFRVPEPGSALLLGLSLLGLAAMRRTRR